MNLLRRSGEGVTVHREPPELSGLDADQCAIVSIDVSHKLA